MSNEIKCGQSMTPREAEFLKIYSDAAGERTWLIGAYPKHVAGVRAVARQLESSLAEAVAALREILASDGSQGTYDAMKVYDAREHANAVIAKHSG